MEVLPHGFARRAETVFHALITLTQFTGYLAYFHTTIDMKTINLATILRQSDQTTLQALHHLSGREDRLHRGYLAADAFDIVLILFVSGMTTIIVVN